MLGAERAKVLQIRNKGEVDSEVLSEVMDALDVEESMIDRRDARAEPIQDKTLFTPSQSAGACPDLANASDTVTPNSTEGCQDCLREGLRWVHLRLCLTCGDVGCCDSSVGKHADRHFAEAGHPVMRSIEPGEAWRWCYVDSMLG